ncbi:SGNH/GDSL hydrolase family protein [Pseudarthrobacter sp. NamE2]|uniref:SGNH/GDSL hydrolase family protein n=1 Tax=Pseudarthrobacter sp. NamE2 TaxID=2576838 RepID=UPI0010FE173B|nr:SGNH/GDSL hydrolase family protein [Pseudarthrobacter sp. NamE2]TLM81702.1 SGNH/GDSL hydrolase family protein [Pseudarthrobacter sp. NamE2]
MRKQSLRITGRLGALAFAITGLLAGFLAAPAAAHSSGHLDYVAFGDSYSAGIGAGEAAPSQLYLDLDDPVLCFQASPGYPDILDYLPGVDLTGKAACAGWSAAMVPFQVQIASNAGVLDDETDLVTITAGGNDVDFAGLLRSCLHPSSLDLCITAVRNAEAVAETQVLAALVNAYSAVRAKAPEATIIALGYPHLFSPEFEGTTVITDEAATVFNNGTDTLNKVIGKAAKQVSGTVYVDVTDEFEGHGIGSPKSWFVLDGSAASFHPTATGYAFGYAAALVREAVSAAARS